MYVSAIVVAAGKGLRLKSGIAKPLVKINSKPIVIYSLSTLSKHPLVREIVVVANSLNIKGILRKIKQYKINKIKNVVLGGSRRGDSVYNGLKAINAGSGLVLIHDAARPFVDAKVISSLIKKAMACGAAIAGVPVKATIKKVSGNFVVKKTLNREDLWEIQTPQVFKKEIILQAYRKFLKLNATDDSMLVEKLGVKVSAVLGSYSNIKITTPEDLAAAKAILKCSGSA